MNSFADSLEIRADAEATAAAFPALLVEAERIAQTVAAGLHGRRRAGPGETFWQHRAYSFGDPVSTIDWRQSARIAGRLYVRENEWEAAAPVYLWRDPSPSLNFRSGKSLPEKRRRADILATAMTILLSQGGERIGLLGDDRRTYHGRTAPARILEALLLDERTSSVPPIATPPVGARAIFFSDFYTDVSAIERAVASLVEKNIVGALVQICDPIEEDFPFRGRVEFRDIESRDRLTFGDANALAEDYKTKFAAHRDALSNLAKRTGWTFITHRTNKPAHQTLLALYAALADARRGMI